MSVATVPTSVHFDLDEKRYWFCGSGCRDRFFAEPATWTGKTNGATHGANGKHGSAAPPAAAAPAAAPAGLATDPVCGMSVATVPASLHVDHDGERFWFCGSGCVRAFSAEPAAWVKV
jgi:YHS domain-containing protein